MTQAELAEANGLVAQFYRRGASYDAMFAAQRRLLVLGVKLDCPLDGPDPRAPSGGSAVAMRRAA